MRSAWLGLLLIGGIACQAAEGPRPRARDDGGLPGVDAGASDAGLPGVDGGDPGVDAGMTPGVDAGFDAGGGGGGDAGGGPTGTGRYLDRCTSDADCASGPCVNDVGGSRFCTRACASTRECADEHACAGGVCVPDDTGAVCAVATPETCRLGLCLGPAGGSGQCTRACDDASECPAGYACTDVGAAFRVCVDIEKPCTAGGNECGSSLCVPGVGCTATCRSAADCPARRFPGLPSYTCETAFGSSVPVCTPPLTGDGGDVAGDDAMGALCPASGLNECRSALCADLAEVGANSCVQTCNAEGGCPVGWGCKPVELDGGAIQTFCVRAGTGALGASCSAASQCASGLCDRPGYCTRLCHGDGLCPTGWVCTPITGTALATCVR